MDEKRIARFWSRVDKRGPDECWEWQGARNHGGHGMGWSGQKTMLTHRIAWLLCNGPITNECVCHKCDNPPCCNPAHLFLGTRADNLADMRAKGRAAPMPRNLGESHPMTPFRESDILAIRSEIAGGGSQSVIARRFGVSSTAVNRIYHRKSWKHVG